MPFANINHAKLYYEQHGHGAPLVLIAGYTCDHTFWIGMLPGLVKKFQVTIFDNRAVGQTKDDGGAITMDRMADDTVALIEQLKLNRPHILGHSMGGGIAQIVAKKYSGNMGKLIIANSAAKLNERSLHAIESMLHMRQQNVDLDTLIEECVSWFFSSNYLAVPDNIAKFKKILTSNPYFQSVEDQARQFQAIQGFDTTHCLPNIKSPTLVLTTEEDIIALPEESEHLAANITNAEMVTIPGAHSVPLEHPRKVSQVVLDFLI